MIYGIGLIFTILLGVVILTNSASAIEYGGIGGKPAYPRSDNPRTNSIFVYTLEPGAVQKDGVLLMNNASETKTLLVDAVDSMVSSGGAFACRQSGESKNDVGNWITLSKSETTLSSAATKVIPFTINVPQNADAGEHDGCIIIQEKKEPTSVQAGMTLSFRTGIRVAITIPGEITKKLEPFDLKVGRNAGSGGILLQPSIKNLGNASVDADVKVVTSDFSGLLFRAQSAGKFPVLRGATSDLSFELKKPFWGGLYRSSFTVSYDATPSAEIGKETGQPKTVVQSASVWFFSFPMPLALAIEIAVICLIVFLGFLFYSARKRRKWIIESWVEYELKAGDDIKTLAEKSNVSWKLLIKANKIKPPYGVKAGEIIKVPPARK